LGFGCGAFAGGYGDVNQKEANDVIRKALKVGINFFDTAPLYSSKNARSEEILGQALQGIPRNSYVLNTKCGRDRVGDERIYNYTASGVRKSLENSLKRLRLEYVDMFTLHDVEFADSIDIIVNEALPEMRKLQKEGYTRSVGISGYPLDVLLIVARRFKLDYVLTYSNYSIQNESLVNYIDEFKKLGCGVLNAAPLVLGFFTRQGPRNWHFAPNEMTQLAPKISKMCDDKGIDVASLAIKYSLHAPLTKSGQITSTLVGITNVQELDVMVKCLEPLTPVETEAVAKAKDIFGKKWLNYRWRESHSNEVKLVGSSQYIPPKSKL